jgi:hypothetical protein
MQIIIAETKDMLSALHEAILEQERREMDGLLEELRNLLESND